MKSLTASAETKRAATERGVRAVLQIDWARDSSWSGKYSDQALTVGDDAYSAYVQSWGSFNCSLDAQKLGSIDDLQVTFKMDDTASFYSDVLTSYDAEGTPVRFGLWFTTTVAADIVWLFYGEINRVSEISADGVKVDIVQFGLTKNRIIPEHEINLIDFPDAPDSAIGKRIPLIYGNVEKVPAIPITAARQTDLYGSHGVADTTIRVYSVDGFPSAGTIKIDDEEITYSSLDNSYSYLGATIAAFLGCTRAANSTEAAIHQHGAVVSEQVDSSVFVVADHACKSVSMVRIAGQLDEDIACVANTNDTTTLSGRTLATIAFSGEPTYKKISEAEVVQKIFPNDAGSENANDDWPKAVDEVEANTYTEVTQAQSPLVVKCETDYQPGDTEDVDITIDTMVHSGYPDQNYVSATTISADYEGGHFARIYLRLARADIPPRYSQAILNLDRNTEYFFDQTVYVTQAAATWDAATLTWNNQPNGTSGLPTGDLLGSFTFANQNLYEFTIPSGVDLEKGLVLWVDTSGAEGARQSGFCSSKMPGAENTPPYIQFITAEVPVISTPDTGRLVSVHAGIEFATSEDFSTGQLQWRVEKPLGSSMSWLDLWDPKWKHSRPATDTIEREISAQIAEAGGAAQLPVWNFAVSTFTVTNVLSKAYYSGILGYAIATDPYWETAMTSYPNSGSGRTPYDSIKCTAINTPAAGTIKKVRCKYRAGSSGADPGRIRLLFYLNATLLHNTGWLDPDDSDRHYTAWSDVSASDYDMETVLTSSSTYILIEADGTGSADHATYLYMAGMEIQFEPAAGIAYALTNLTTTNFFDVIAQGMLDAGDDDPWDWFDDAHIAVRNVSYDGEFRVYNLWFRVSYLPIETVTSSLSDITCDVEGVESVGDGSGTLLENPADIIEDIMLNRLGFLAGDLDATSFAAAVTALSDRGAKFGFALTESIDGLELLAQLAHQARCWLRAEAAAYHLDLRPAPFGTAARAISTTGVSARLPATGRLVPLGLANIFNRIVLKYKRDYSDESDEPYKESARSDDSASQTLYGIRELHFEGSFIRDGEYALNFANWLCMQYARRRSLYKCKTLAGGNIDLERGDIISITDARVGLTAVKGELVALSYQPGAVAPDGSGRPHTLELVAALEPYVWSWSDSGDETGDPGDAGTSFNGDSPGTDSGGFYAVG